MSLQIICPRCGEWLVPGTPNTRFSAELPNWEHVECEEKPVKPFPLRAGMDRRKKKAES